MLIKRQRGRTEDRWVQNYHHLGQTSWNICKKKCPTLQEEMDLCSLLAFIASREPVSLICSVPTLSWSRTNDFCCNLDTFKILQRITQNKTDSWLYRVEKSDAETQSNQATRYEAAQTSGNVVHTVLYQDVHTVRVLTMWGMKREKHNS